MLTTAFAAGKQNFTCLILGAKSGLRNRLRKQLRKKKIVKERKEKYYVTLPAFPLLEASSPGSQSCGHLFWKTGWFPSLTFLGKVFTEVQWKRCKTLSALALCSKWMRAGAGKPRSDFLSQMYQDSFVSTSERIDGSQQPSAKKALRAPA